MKCIQCGTDNKLKDRTANQGRCTKCQHRFAFEPTSMGKVKITDPMFAKVISDISVNNTLFFTPKQLAYFLDNRLKSRSAITVISGVFTYIIINMWVSLFLVSIISGILKINAFPYVILLINLIYILIIYSNSKSSQLNDKARRSNARYLQILGAFILIVGILAGLFVYESFTIFAISVIIGMLSLYLGKRQLGKIGIAQEFLFQQNQLQDWITRWQQINGLIQKILPSPRQENTHTTVNPDVTAYSFDRLVVCDSAAIAQFLIANNFHFENNCAILSITGYPQNIFATTMQMVRRNSDLKVYALHDCSPQGIRLTHHLRSNDNWFAGSNITIIDVGLLPRQIMANKRGMFIQSDSNSAVAAKQLPVDVRQNLSTEELQWLDNGNFVELESFSPQKLLQIVQRGMVSTLTLESDESNLILIGDTGSDIYAVESFG
ncbi:MAG: hypothetical protein VKL59_05005 [Nostocaceae cyanobacterium]|nr:hypothetical protein [Nostocaceae cyanobacterium]